MLYNRYTINSIKQMRRDPNSSNLGRRTTRDVSGPRPGPEATSAASLDRLAELYMENISSPGSQLELEIRFGTLGFRTLTHNDHSNVIDRIL